MNDSFALVPRKAEKAKKAGNGSLQYLGVIGEIGYAIAVPIAGGALLGVAIDRVWFTTPKATLSLLFLGVFVSFFSMYKTVQRIIKET